MALICVRPFCRAVRPAAIFGSLWPVVSRSAAEIESIIWNTDGEPALPSPNAAAPSALTDTVSVPLIRRCTVAPPTPA